MKRFFASLTIGLLICVGIRAPEAHEFSRGICLSGAVLEKAADSSQNSHEFHNAASNPLLLHSGFAPAAHPFDFPETVSSPDAAISHIVGLPKSFFPGNPALFPPDRPPTVLFF